MKILLLAAFFASRLPVVAGEPDIGTIVSAVDLPPKKSAISVSYDYDGKGKLVLSLDNIAMNAAAKGVIGSVAVKGKEIVIRPKERYDPRGPFESIRWYRIQYVIQNIQPGRYSLIHDDSAAEGQDRETKTELDLTIAGRGTKTVTFKDPDPSEDPFAEPPKTKAGPDGGGQPATRSKSK